MIDKYYTPSIEEFHVGFEYFEKVSDVYILKTYGTNKDIPLLESDESLFYSIEEGLNEGCIWCKYIDKEDIKSFGFEQTMYKKSSCYTINKIYYLWYSKYNNLFPYISISTVLNGEHEQYFRGTIKNKSELRKLLQQLGLDSINL